ncbi:uncharacterized protein N7477_006923 [Penicillium maclennaniae]|uniref:uncharacterized protein n=1 Tax=Penicillium maclennaniae TaxID=1343394 RepID=UPI00253FF8AB|nr:uncharacterized protein N7477_006923 [Penicillium maclennaniae]KAJ5668353.1 hypothetical protein N7477_006923 [Penicillium maclennaniae]
MGFMRPGYLSESSELPFAGLPTFRLALDVFTLTLILVPIYFIGKITYNVFFHPLAKYPGPKSMAATRIPYMHLILAGQMAQAVKVLHDKYGEVVRIAPDELSFINGDAWKAIYGTRPGHGQKPKDYRFYPRPSMALPENAEAGKQALDMVSWYNFTTFDIIGDLAFGEPFDCLKNSTYHQWVSIVLSSIKFGAYTNVARRFPGWKILSKLITPQKVSDQRNMHMQLTKEKVQGRLMKTNERPDFFANILQHNDTEKGFSIPEMITNGSTLIVAGSETTATALSGVTYLLLKNPRVMQKLQEEVRGAFKSDDQITLENCNKLEYIHAVLTEALRMYPPVAVGLPRVVDGQGDTIAGHFVPGGTIVSVTHMAAYHSAMNFKHPEKFIPERFLNDPEFANDSKTVMQPFSFGPRNCIGRNLAYVEMRIILARMVFNFDMELDQPSDEWTDQQCFLLWEKKPLMVRLTPRTKMQ